MSWLPIGSAQALQGGSRNHAQAIIHWRRIPKSSTATVRFLFDTDFCWHSGTWERSIKPRTLLPESPKKA